MVGAIGGAFVTPTSTPLARLGLAVGHRCSSIPKVIDSRLKPELILLSCTVGTPEELPSIPEAKWVAPVDSMGSESSRPGLAARLAVVVLAEMAPGTTG